MADGFDVLAWIRFVWSPGCSLDVHGGAVLTVLCRHADAQGIAFPSLTTIAIEAKTSRTKAVATVAELERQGLIRRERRSQGAGHDRNLYRLPLTPPGGAPGVPSKRVSGAPGVPSKRVSGAPGVPVAEQPSSPGEPGVVRGATLGSAPGDLEVIQELHKQTTQRGAARRKRRSLWRVVPADWEPKERHLLFAKERKIDIDRELRKFRRYEYSRGKSDADVEFDNWLERADEYARRGGSPRSAPLLQQGTADRVRTGNAYTEDVPLG